MAQGSSYEPPRNAAHVGQGPKLRKGPQRSVGEQSGGRLARPASVGGRRSGQAHHRIQRHRTMDIVDIIRIISQQQAASSSHIIGACATWRLAWLQTRKRGPPGCICRRASFAPQSIHRFSGGARLFFSSHWQTVVFQRFPFLLLQTPFSPGPLQPVICWDDLFSPAG